MAILIKRYANRKLYNTQTSRYITLKGIAELIDDGDEVRVIDNETGEDITNVALSQILVDSERSNSDVSGSLLSQIFGRGGDALYEALRKSVDDASENLGDFQDRFRRFVAGESEEHGDGPRRRGRDHRSLSDWIAYASPDFEQIVQKSMERVFKLLDLPRRSDIEALNRNLERVAEAVETLEKVYERRESSSPTPTPRT
jgi:polyhydroxyalkanoate synthesis repressor PhaR